MPDTIKKGVTQKVVNMESFNLCEDAQIEEKPVNDLVENTQSGDRKIWLLEYISEQMFAGGSTMSPELLKEKIKKFD